MVWYGMQYGRCTTCMTPRGIHHQDEFNVGRAGNGIERGGGVWCGVEDWYIFLFFFPFIPWFDLDLLLCATLAKKRNVPLRFPSHPPPPVASRASHRLGFSTCKMQIFDYHLLVFSNERMGKKFVNHFFLDRRFNGRED